MDPNLLPPVPSQPQNLKDKISETSGEFVKNNYEGFLHKLVNISYAVLKFIRSSLMSMISMVLNRE
jgi:hypothetical protein